MLPGLCRRVAGPLQLVLRGVEPVAQRVRSAALARNGLLRSIRPGLGGPSIGVCRISPFLRPIRPLFGLFDPRFGPFRAAVSRLKQRR
jgi:hypothetical protein